MMLVLMVVMMDAGVDGCDDDDDDAMP